MKNNKIKLAFRVLSVLLMMTLIIETAGITKAFAANTEEPYDSYNYDYWGYIHYTPSPYTTERVINGESLTFNGENLGPFDEPEDFCKDAAGNLYIADTGNNRIVVMDPEVKNVIRVITGYTVNGEEKKFNQPYGICVSAKNQLYICDSGNKKIVVLDNDTLEYVKVVEKPRSESLDENFVFTPLKVAVDYADRVYCIAKNQFQGIMVFEEDGSFATFFGTIEVKISAWEKFWKRLATREERSHQRLFIPTEFTGVDIDPDGFVFATNIDSEGIQGVRRLNPSGQDVIKKGENANVGGDLNTEGNSDYAGPSQFADVVYRDNGMYSCVDKRRGRIFTYDYEGNLLYIFGGLGTQAGTLLIPSAIEAVGDRIVVLDSQRSQVVIYAVTEYGDLINRAVALRYDGDETEAVALWERVLELDEDNELANTGIGKAYLSAGDYKLAMKYLKLGVNKNYYAIAYKRYRNAWLVEYVSYFLTGAVVIIAGIIIFVNVRKRRKGAKE